MKRIIAVVSLCLFVFGFSGMVWSGEKAPQKVVDLANTSLAKLGLDPIVVKAVQEANAKGQTLDQIKAMDAKWTDQAGIADYMKALMDSECGKYLGTIQKSAPYYAEIFVMDNQGANVAMTDKTSDYWQGDEDKFQKSFNKGQGAVFVDEVEFDDSSQAYLVQISVPVMDADKAVGAITFGIDIDKVQ
ncbi:MAG: PDC sensor domain-containing protein [Thermodesulfobacteriota bacterium]